MNYFKGFLGAAAALLILPITSACTSATSDIRTTLNYAIFTSSAKDVDLSAEEIAAFPYSAQYAQRDGQARILLVLGFIDEVDNQEQLSWISRDNITMVTENGRIIRTQGQTARVAAAKLGQTDLIDVSNREHDPLRCIVAAPSNCEYNWQREIDYIDRERRRSVNVASSFSVANEPTLMRFPEREYYVYHISETGRFIETGETFTNEFWALENGHVLRSKQTLLPKSEYISLLQVKRVGEHD